MCKAELNVSLLPCRHRWFHLVDGCTPTTDLSNCGSKLGLQGWEIKCEFCPFCAEWDASASEYKLIGNDSTPAVGGLTRTPSISLRAARRESRRGSLSRSNSSTSITAMASEKNKAMNARVDAYLCVTPPESSRPAPLQEADDEEASEGSTDGSLRRSSTSSQTKTSGFMQKFRTKSQKYSFGMLK
ncbi:hypothetical protein M011DRAFT_457879 [Sporormia fimetaria CBS 119925]|uniref:Uncharacterized protein n=1 Tax=Sporormia fimetaria CBS 119925 TaxID=1340428 RepID=A0A6A6VDX8_9PLEO|nr:hypothetical protein M011DRAFT_457879 [Sporormia fimetaria CBS 119925]